VGVVPADAAVGGLCLVAGEPPPTTATDARQSFGVEVHEVAGGRPAVAHHGLTRLKQAQTVQAVAPQGAVDGRRGEAGVPGDPGRSAAFGEAQEHDAAQELADHAQGDALRARGTVDKSARTCTAPAPEPLAGRLAADPGRGGGFTQAPTFALDAPTEQEPAVQSESRVRMRH